MFEDLLKKAGLKITTPRVKIFKLLHQKGQHHWSAEAIRKELVRQKINIGLATIYRVLTQLESAGLVKKNYFEQDISSFELADNEHHDHIVCLRCGLVEEFMDDIIEQHQLKIVKQRGFEMLDHRLIIYGLCAHCLQNSSHARKQMDSKVS